MIFHMRDAEWLIEMDKDIKNVVFPLYLASKMELRKL